VRECRRDISESSGAFGVIAGSPLLGVDAAEGRAAKEGGERPAGEIVTVVSP